MKLKNFQMPKGVIVDDDTLTDNYGKFTIAPLERGLERPLAIPSAAFCCLRYLALPLLLYELTV